MTRDEIFDRLMDVFADVFDQDDISLDEDTTASDVDGWDSLTHITLLEAVEDEFDIHFDMKAVQELRNVGDLVDMIIELSA